MSVIFYDFYIPFAQIKRTWTVSQVSYGVSPASTIEGAPRPFRSVCSTLLDETRGGAAGRTPNLVEIRIHPFAEMLMWIPEVA